MEFPELHRWTVDYGEARRLQEELSSRVKLCPLPETIRFVAGADVAFAKELNRCFASVVLLSFPELETVEVCTASAATAFPYIPGLLSFREGEVALGAFRKLKQSPDVVIFDGQGRAHPRRMGLASHLGLWLQVPTVGCAKSRLVGEYETPGIERGQHTPLLHDGEKIGDVVRTRRLVKPVFVSPGHLADFDGARRIVLDCCTRYRLPEPTRLAHTAVAEAKRRYLAARGTGPHE